MKVIRTYLLITMDLYGIAVVLLYIMVILS